MTLTVELTRFEKSRNLCARVVQKSGREFVRGSNLLSGRRIRRIETAKQRVLDWFRREAPAIETISFDVQASADLQPPYKHVSRQDLHRDLDESIVPARSPEKQAIAFNSLCPVGSPVRYWTGAREGLGKEGITRSEASVLEGHTAVVWIEGCAGCIALSHVEPLPQ